MPTPAAQTLMDAKAALDVAKGAAVPLRAALVAAQVAQDAQDQAIQQLVLAYQVALNALLVESGNVPDAA